MDFTLTFKRFTAALLLAAPLLLPNGAAAQEDPEAVYSKLHKAMLAANLGEMLKYASDAQRKELDAIPQAQKVATVQLMAKMMPASYSVAGTTINPDGKSAELRVTGMATGLMSGKPEMNYGVVKLVKENNAWKVERTEWSNTQPAGFQLAQAPKPAAATPAPASAASTPAPAADAPAKEEDVEANEEQMSKARKEEEAVMRKKAAEDAAAERQRQREVRMALCVIRPVMTDAEIDFCKAAYRD